MQKPEALTTFGQLNRINNIYLEIKDLTPTMDGYFIPAYSGQGHWFFHSVVIR
jgi:hypothetical protein